MNEEFEEVLADSKARIYGVVELVSDFQKDYINYLKTFHTLLDGTNSATAEYVLKYLKESKKVLTNTSNKYKAASNFNKHGALVIFSFIDNLISLIEQGMEKAKE